MSIAQEKETIRNETEAMLKNKDPSQLNEEAPIKAERDATQMVIETRNKVSTSA